ncbi:MAG: hypothetical protein E7484_06780 [Ruminococcaceae bacterium]|nr:hypothetical protein [Oscillospiraceae bacterium]
MKNNGMGMIRSAMIGMAVGTAITAAGAMYLKDNSSVQSAMHKAKESKKIITRAGENIVREIRD